MSPSSELLEVGAHCHLQSCNQLDFLPFRCGNCNHLYCADHWRVEQHDCHNNSNNSKNAINHAPVCPLCSKTVPFPGGQDVNEAMDRHLSNDCPVSNPFKQAKQSQKAPSNICKAPQCKTKVLVPIKCPQCSFDYCAKHRLPNDHSCSKKYSSSSSTSAPPSSKSSPSANAFVTAMKRAKQSIPDRPQSTQSAPPQSKQQLQQQPKQVKPTTTTNKPNPAMQATSKLNPIKTRSERRAKAEAESQRMALERRARLGIMTEEDKVHYATIQAKEHGSYRQNSNANKESCVVH